MFNFLDFHIGLLYSETIQKKIKCKILNHLFVCIDIVLQLIWSYRRNLTIDVRFDSAVTDVCASALHQVCRLLMNCLLAKVFIIVCIQNSNKNARKKLK